MVNRIRDAFELLRKTPAGKQALEEHEREISTEREDHVAAIEKAQAKLHDALPKLTDAVAKADAQWERARKAADAAEATHRAARSARGSAIHRAGSIRGTHQDDLAKGADPRIAGVVAKLRFVYLKEAIGGLIIESEETGRYDPRVVRYPNPQVRVSNNSAARLRRMAAMRDAIKAISDLRFHCKASVGDEMQAILEGIPDGSELEFAYTCYQNELRSGYVVDLYRPIDVAEGFSEVLEPAEFLSRDNDGGSGGAGSGDFPEGMPSGIPMAR